MPKSLYWPICTPTLGVVSMEWAQRLHLLQLPMNCGMFDCFVMDEKGGQIAESRNLIVQRCLNMVDSGHGMITHLFWLDDDVLCHPAAIRALKSLEADIASGVYFTKDRGGISEPLILPSQYGGSLPFYPNRIFECWGHGMGLTLVKIEVYRAMLAQGLPRDKLGNPQWYKTTTPEDEKVDDDGCAVKGGTEDLYFLDAAHKLGFKSIVDTSLQTFGWHYDYHDRRGYPLKQWEQYQSGKPVIWDTPDGPQQFTADHLPKFVSLKVRQEEANGQFAERQLVEA